MNDTTETSRVRKYIGYVGLPLFLIASFFYAMAGVGHLILLLPLGLAKIAGLAACAVLVTKSVGGSKLLQRLCPEEENSGCGRVMDSPAGKIFGIPMADLGLLYFAGGFLALFLSFFTGQLLRTLFMLGLLNLFTLPYTFFSVVYQAFVVRSWCRLCLRVQAVFWAEFAILYGITFEAMGSTTWLPPFTFIFAFGCVTLTWIALRPQPAPPMDNESPPAEDKK